jgi:hypothetical protein
MQSYGLLSFWVVCAFYGLDICMGGENVAFFDDAEQIPCNYHHNPCNLHHGLCLFIFEIQWVSSNFFLVLADILRFTATLHDGRRIVQSAFNVKLIQAGAYEPQIPLDTDSMALPSSQDISKNEGSSFDQILLGFSPGKTNLCSPLYVSYAEIQRLYEQFKDDCGVWYFSQEFFLAYVTYSARAARLSAYKQQISTSDHGWPKVTEAAVDSLELCQLSMYSISYSLWVVPTILTLFPFVGTF